MEREVFLFGHLVMVERITTIAIVTDIQIQFGHCQYRVQPNVVWCLGIRKNVVQHWPQHTAVVAKKNDKLLQPICIIHAQHHIQAHLHRLHWLRVLLLWYWRQIRV